MSAPAKNRTKTGGGRWEKGRSGNPNGRTKGIRNKSTADVKALAGKYTDAAMAELGRLATQAESEAARVAAIKELLDRAYGKAAQQVDVQGRVIVLAGGYVAVDDNATE